MGEPPETRLRRLRMRSWRRGMRELDLILGPFADEALAGLDAEALAGFEALIAEPDGDLYAWLIGAASVPRQHAEIVDRIRAQHRPGRWFPARPPLNEL